MCGIAGSVNYKLSYEAIKKAMLHRGPDEQNGFQHLNIDLYHLRLSILDISGGKQPMTIKGRYTIIFNGEIYNHQALRKQFNFSTSTNSDTEILLLLFEKMGEACLQYLDGMFAFAIFDSVERKIFLARDRAGKKPLYYYKDNDKIVFASELNCLKHLLPLEINTNHFFHYLRFGTFYKKNTPYINVNELSAGSCMYIDCDTLHIQQKKWWDIHNFFIQKSEDTFDTALSTTDELLHEAVKRRIESSDLEVGAFLSGGIDSGLITAIASNYVEKLKTVTVSFEGSYNEAPLAKLVAEKYNTNHSEIDISYNSLRNDIERIISNYGEPFFDSSAIPSFYVSKEAKKNVTVVLTGDGADELFGGYRRYIPFVKHDFFQNNKTLKCAAQIVHSMLPLSNDKKTSYNKLYRLLSLAKKSGIQTYLSAGLDIFEDYEKNILADDIQYLGDVVEDFNRINENDVSGLKKIMNLDFDIFLFNDVLTKMDIATMNNSLEARSPFLSKEILEYAPTIKDEYKVHGGTTKLILRKLAEKYLPSAIIHQPKRGFEVPLKNWVHHELKDLVFDYVGASDAFSKRIIRPAFMQGLLENKIKVPAEKRAKMLWTIFCLEVWYKKVYLN